MPCCLKDTNKAKVSMLLTSMIGLIFQAIPHSKSPPKRTLRVLSLFDGIAAGWMNFVFSLSICEYGNLVKTA